MSRIDDELQARFDRATREFVAPDAADLKRRRRSHDLRVRTARIGLTVVVVAATIATFVVARTSFGPDSGERTAASLDDPTAYGTYVITEVGLRRPEADELHGSDDPRRTFIVEYRTAWSGEMYPGEHDCRWVVLDSEGRELGAAEGSLSTIGSGGPNDDPSGINVAITGDPSEASSAQVTCDPARQDTPIAYEISEERVARTFRWQGEGDPGVIVEFRVGWPVEPPEYPSENWCRVEVFRPNGERVASGVFTLATGPRSIEHRVWPGDFSDPTAVAEAASLSAEVTCEPYMGQQPVVTVDSTVEEKIAGLEFLLGELSSELEATTSEAEASMIQAQIRTIEEHVARLRAQLTPDAAPEA